MLVQAIKLAIVTAYCGCTICTPGSGITASGESVQEGLTIAGPSELPFYTQVHIESVGMREVHDRTHRRYDGRFDIYFEEHEDALSFGKRRLKVCFHVKVSSHLDTATVGDSQNLMNLDR